MRTTIDIPDSLYQQAKIAAVKKGSSLRELVIDALEHELSPSKKDFKTKPDSKMQEDQAPYHLDKMGLPVLKCRPGVTVTNEMIDKLREEEGV